MIPEHGWRLYEALLRVLAEDGGAATVLWEFERRHPVDVEGMLDFLREVEFVNGDPPALSEAGNAYAMAKFGQSNNEAVAALLRRQLEAHAETIKLCQTLYGRPKVGLANVQFVLKCAGSEGNRTSVVHFLDLLNFAKIVVYSRKHGSVRMEWQPDAEEVPPPASFITPQTPFSNLKRLRQVLGSLQGHVYWIDKHFDKKAFDAIAEAADGATWRSLTIISGTANVTQSAKVAYERLRDEVSNRQITIEWRLCQPPFERTFHDRWLVADNTCYNMPPVNSIYKGQEAEILRTDAPPDVKRYVANSSPVPITGGANHA